MGTEMTKYMVEFKNAHTGALERLFLEARAAADAASAFLDVAGTIITVTPLGTPVRFRTRKSVVEASAGVPE